MKISVFISSYNQCDYLREAIESVLAQTFPASQIIVVDDASSDGSPDLIADYTRQYPGLFTPIYHKQNTGIAQVRIDALKAVTGDYVSYVDGDDWFLPEKLEKESEALRLNPEAQIAFSNNEYVTEDGSALVYRWVDSEPVPQGNVFWQTIGRAFPRRSLFRMELVHYNSWRKIGFHDPSLLLYEDFDMRIRLTQRLKVVYVDQVLSRIRAHQSGLSTLDPEQHFAALESLFDKYLPLINTLSDHQAHKALTGLVRWMAPMGVKAAVNSLSSGKLRTAFRLGWGTIRYLRLMI